MFKTKWDIKDNVKRYKTNLTAKGFAQREAMTIKILSLIFMEDSFKIIMVLVAHFDQELHQMDVKTAFLDGDIEEKIYMVNQIVLKPKVHNI